MWIRWKNVRDHDLSAGVSFEKNKQTNRQPVRQVKTSVLEIPIIAG